MVLRATALLLLPLLLMLLVCVVVLLMLLLFYIEEWSYGPLAYECVNYGPQYPSGVIAWWRWCDTMVHLGHHHGVNRAIVFTRLTQLTSYGIPLVHTSKNRYTKRSNIQRVGVTRPSYCLSCSSTVARGAVFRHCH